MRNQTFDGCNWGLYGSRCKMAGSRAGWHRKEPPTYQLEHTTSSKELDIGNLFGIIIETGKLTYLHSLNAH